MIDAGRAKIAVRLACINPGNEGSLTDTRGQLIPQVRRRRSPVGADSQADSAGPIPVTRSNAEPQVKRSLEHRPDDVAIAVHWSVPDAEQVSAYACADGVSEHLVSLGTAVLVDERGAHAAMSHPVHLPVAR